MKAEALASAQLTCKASVETSAPAAMKAEALASAQLVRGARKTGGSVLAAMKAEALASAQIPGGVEG